MQEPTLFNYTVKENIMYGNQTASNTDIIKASLAANACEFIESKELEIAFDNNTDSLFSLWESSEIQKILEEKIGKEEYIALQEKLI